MEFVINHIRDLCIKVTDGSHFSPIDELDGKYEMYSVKDMEYNGFNSENCKHVGEEVFKKLSKGDCRPLKNDILIAKDGSYLKYAFKCKETLNSCILSSIAILRPNLKVINPDYFVYLMRTQAIKGAMANYVSGSALPRIILSDFKKMKIKMIPNLDIQLDIAKVLTKYDELIDNNNKRIKMLESICESIFKEWFVRFRNPLNIRNEFGKVGDICTIRSGFAYKSSDWQKDGIQVVKIKDIIDGYVSTDDLDAVPIELASKAENFNLHELDLVIAMTGATIGKVGLVVKDGLNTNQRVGKIFANKQMQNISPFLFCFFRQPSILETILMYSGASSAQPNISGEMLQKINMPFNERLINLFDDMCKPIFQEIVILKNKNVNLIKQRDSLLPRLMSGKLSVEGKEVI